MQKLRELHNIRYTFEAEDLNCERKGLSDGQESTSIVLQETLGVPKLYIRMVGAYGMKITFESTGFRADPDLSSGIEVMDPPGKRILRIQLLDLSGVIGKLLQP